MAHRIRLPFIICVLLLVSGIGSNGEAASDTNSQPSTQSPPPDSSASSTKSTSSSPSKADPQLDESVEAESAVDELDIMQAGDPEVAVAAAIQDGAATDGFIAHSKDAPHAEPVGGGPIRASELSEDQHSLLLFTNVELNEDSARMQALADHDTKAPSTDDAAAATGTDSQPATISAAELEAERRLNRSLTLFEEAMLLREDTDSDAINYDSVLHMLDEAAELGNIEALNAIGEMYLFGEGRPSDFQMARRYFDGAAEFGSADAQHNRGFMYAFGLGYDDEFPPLPAGEPSNHTTEKPSSTTTSTDGSSASSSTPTASTGTDAKPDAATDTATTAKEPIASSPATVSESTLKETDWTRRHREMLSNLAGVRDEPQAVLNYYFASLSGSQRAQMALGYRHMFGYGVPKSCDASIKYYNAVAEKVIMNLAEEAPMLIERLRLTDEQNRYKSPDESEDVISYYQASAEAGDVHAQSALGQLHYYGARGVEHNPERAANYFRAAAAQGDAASMSSLAQMHVQGMGVEKNNETALHWFRQAEKLGDPSALNGLGFLYMHGQGVEQDYKQALKYFKLAADKGSGDAQFNLGVLYFAGMGVDKSYPTALQYFSQAATQGHTRALFNLGQMHMNGFGTVASCSIGVRFLKTVAERGSWAQSLGDAHRAFLRGENMRALLLYARAAEEGHEVAEANVAWMLNEAIGFPFANNRQLAFKLFQHAAKQGNVDAQRALGDYFYYGWIPKSVADANQLAANLASHSSSPAPSTPSSSSSSATTTPPTTTPPKPSPPAIVLPDLIAQTRMSGVPDFELAMQQYIIAANKKSVHAMFNLGYMFEHGIGSARDFHLAQRYYDMASSTDPSAYFPVQVALVKLWCHRMLYLYLPWTLPYLNGARVQLELWWSSILYSDAPSNMSTTTTATTITTEHSPLPTSSATPSDDTSFISHVYDVFHRFRVWFVSFHHSTFPRFYRFASWLVKLFGSMVPPGYEWEDTLLLVLCGLLAFLIYLRARPQRFNGMLQIEPANPAR